MNSLEIMRLLAHGDAMRDLAAGEVRADPRYDARVMAVNGLELKPNLVDTAVDEYCKMYRETVRAQTIQVEPAPPKRSVWSRIFGRR